MPAVPVIAPVKERLATYEPQPVVASALVVPAAGVPVQPTAPVPVAVNTWLHTPPPDTVILAVSAPSTLGLNSI